MTDLNKLPPAALAAAMKTGTVEWGVWGSATEHALYVQEIPRLRKGWRMCRCGCRRRATHAVMANGLTLGSGCELSAQRKRRDWTARAERRRRKP